MHAIHAIYSIYAIYGIHVIYGAFRFGLCPYRLGGWWPDAIPAAQPRVASIGHREAAELPLAAGARPPLGTLAEVVVAAPAAIVLAVPGPGALRVDDARAAPHLKASARQAADVMRNLP